MVAVIVPLLAGCGLLDVSDPMRMEEDELQNATSADLLRRDVLMGLVAAFGSEAKFAGIVADELYVDPLPSSSVPAVEEAADRRESGRYEELMSSSSDPYYRLQGVRRSASTALPFVRQYVQEPVRSAYATQLLALRGLATLTLAEDYCPGFPLNDLIEGRLVRRPPVTTANAFERALADFDSAIALNTDSARYLNLARVGKARALLGLGRIEDAGAAVPDVPTDYMYSTATTFNPLVLGFSAFGLRVSVADREGSHGLDYVSSHDPRVLVTSRGAAFNGVDTLYAMDKYPGHAAPVVIASGIEARLIEAEAALRTGGDWLGILNALRRNNVTPQLADTTDPGTDAARVDLLFRERAFWLFVTGRRLGDLRRLVAHYDRQAETVFPSGQYRIGGAYGTATSLPFPAAAEHADNPAISGCTTR